MSISVKKIDYTNPEEMNDFYGIGEDIRKRNDGFEFEWTESKNIPEFLSHEDVNHHVFIIDDEEGMGRLIAFQFQDDLEKGFIGWYECDDDNEVSNALLDAAEDWLKAQNVKSIQGPMNGSSWGTFRFNVDADRPLFVTEPYQPIYYIDQWKNFGFEDGVLYQTNIVPKEISKPMSLEDVHGLAAMVGVKFNTWPKNTDDNGHKDMHEFFHECFKDNELYRPITFETYKATAIKLEKIIDFDHSFLVTDQDDKPVSVLVSYRDVYHDNFKKGELKSETHNTHTLYMKTICTAPKWRGNHISRVLVNYGLNVAYDNGYDEVVFGTMMVNNNSAKYSRSFFNAEALRTYAFMVKKL